MEDALTASQFIQINQEEWFTDLGYPCLVFEWSKLDAYTRALNAAGYKVWALEKAAQSDKQRCKVVSITSLRNTLAQRRHKWA
jgi:hypothetical protein